MDRAVAQGEGIYLPDQPFLVIHAREYWKCSVKKRGILCFYAFMTDGQVPLAKLFPAGCIDLLFCCDSQAPEAWVYGPILSARRPNRVLRENTYYFGVQFMPGWLPAILRGREHFADYIEQELPMAPLLPDGTLVERVTASRVLDRQIRLFWEAYMPLYEAQMAAPMVNQGNQIARIIRRELLLDSTNGQIQQLADQMNMSARYLNRVFQQEFGMSPKLFFSLIRFQQLLIQINRDDKSLTLDALAKYCGYYDRSHMAKDFQTFSSMSLRSYQKLIRSTSYQNLSILC